MKTGEKIPAPHCSELHALNSSAPIFFEKAYTQFLALHQTVILVATFIGVAWWNNHVNGWTVVFPPHFNDIKQNAFHTYWDWGKVVEKKYSSGMVKDLVAGSGIEFEALGPKTLKGVPDQWQVFRVRSC